jgi:2-polyprenyl-3-methyl-5-hydroxy-6-metoxy-1,4-benzoquinol methylase
LHLQWQKDTIAILFLALHNHSNKQGQFMRRCFLFLAAIALMQPLFAQQQGQTANTQVNGQTFEEMVKALERPDRASWQKPEEVIAALGPIKGLKVVDIGCGTGYFSFRLEQAGANVIAADIDERFLGYVDSVRKARGITEKNLQTRKLPADDPKLDKREVNIAFMVNTYHHIENRKAYFAKVKAGLKGQGFVVIIDYFKKELPIGPPVSMKLSAEEIIRELTLAGFSNFKVDDKMLPFQYILYAQ